MAYNLKKEDPLKILVDANLSRNYVKELKRLELGEIIYVNDKKNHYNLKHNSPDEDIMQCGYDIDAYIATQDKDFRFYEKVILLKSRKKTKYLIEETLNLLGHLI